MVQIKEIKTGLKFAASTPIIRTLIVNLGILSLAGLGFVTLLPVWAVDVLGGDATTNGFLHTARGLGALSGALLIAAVGQTYSKGKLFTIATFVMPIFLFMLSLTKVLPTSFIALLGTGWGIAPELFDRGWPTLSSIKGAAEYNHLPVRAAAAIMFDRLLQGRD